MFPRQKEAVFFFQLLFVVSGNGVMFHDTVIKRFFRSHVAMCWPQPGDVSA